MDKNNKEVTIRSAFPDSYEIYEDGSMKAQCKRCKNFEEVPEERAKKIQKIPDWSASFTCTPCWKKSKEPADNDRQEQIAFGQSWNLAVNVVGGYYEAAGDGSLWTSQDEYEKQLERWQKYFYEKLTNR
jgi:hypothetical protein